MAVLETTVVACLLAVLCFSAAAAAAAAAAGPCDDGEVYNEICYRFNSRDNDFRQASLQCKSNGQGDLPIIKDDATNKFILDFASKKLKQQTAQKSVWIGVSSEPIPWTWVKGNLKAEANITKCYYTPKNTNNRLPAHYTNEKLSPTQCQNACFKQKKTPLAGVYGGNMCVCGSEKDLEFYVATPCGRGKQCGGDFTRRCGRHDTTDMYSIQAPYYSNWDDRQRRPESSNKARAPNSCAVMNRDYSTPYDWGDVWCLKEYSYICEIDKTPTECNMQRNHVVKNGLCYYVNEGRRTWFKARTDCKQRGGDLAKILTETQHNAIKSIISGINSKYYIGLTNRKYTWVTGGEMDFDNIGQIDTGQLISGYALSMDIETGRWIVHSYTRPLPYVCAAACAGCPDTTPMPATVPAGRTTLQATGPTPSGTKPSTTATSGAAKLDSPKYIFIYVGASLGAVVIVSIIICLSYFFSPRMRKRDKTPHRIIVVDHTPLIYTNPAFVRPRRYAASQRSIETGSLLKGATEEIRRIEQKVQVNAKPTQNKYRKKDEAPSTNKTERQENEVEKEAERMRTYVHRPQVHAQVEKKENGSVHGVETENVSDLYAVPKKAKKKVKVVEEHIYVNTQPVEESETNTSERRDELSFESPTSDDTEVDDMFDFDQYKDNDESETQAPVTRTLNKDDDMQERYEETPSETVENQFDGNESETFEKKPESTTFITVQSDEDGDKTIYGKENDLLSEEARTMAAISSISMIDSQEEDLQKESETNPTDDIAKAQYESSSLPSEYQDTVAPPAAMPDETPSWRHSPEMESSIHSGSFSSPYESSSLHTSEREAVGNAPPSISDRQSLRSGSIIADSEIPVNIVAMEIKRRESQISESEHNMRWPPTVVVAHPSPRSSMTGKESQRSSLRLDQDKTVDIVPLKSEIPEAPPLPPPSAPRHHSNMLHPTTRQHSEDDDDAASFDEVIVELTNSMQRMKRKKLEREQLQKLDDRSKSHHISLDDDIIAGAFGSITNDDKDSKHSNDISTSGETVRAQALTVSAADNMSTDRQSIDTEYGELDDSQRNLASAETIEISQHVF